MKGTELTCYTFQTETKTSRFSLPHENNHQSLQKELNSKTYRLQPTRNYLFKDKLLNNLSHIDHHNNEVVLTARVMKQPFKNHRIFVLHV